MRPPASIATLFARPWSLALLAECFLGVRRFDQFQRRLGISRKTLSQRLSSLVDAGVLIRERYQSKPDRFEYLLTAKGRDLFPILLAIMSWGERWDGTPDDPAWHVEHIPCQRRRDISIVCTHCAEQVCLQDVRLASGGLGRETFADTR